MDRTLIVIPSVSTALVDDGYYLDVKVVDGMRHYADEWPGPVVCLMRLGSIDDIALGRNYKQEDVPFTVQHFDGNLGSVRQHSIDRLEPKGGICEPLKID